MFKMTKGKNQVLLSHAEEQDDEETRVLVFSMSRKLETMAKDLKTKAEQLRQVAREQKS